MSENDRLTARQQRAIEVLLREPTTRAAAEAAKVSEATIWRWLAEPVFSAAYRAARARVFETALNTLQAAATEAVETLRNVLTDLTAKPGEKVSAARVILEYGLKSREQLELEERLATLEALLKPKEKKTA